MHIARLRLKHRSALKPLCYVAVALLVMTVPPSAQAGPFTLFEASGPDTILWSLVTLRSGTWRT